MGVRRAVIRKGLVFRQEENLDGIVVNSRDVKDSVQGAEDRDR